MNFKHYSYLVKSDLFRYRARTGTLLLLTTLWGNEGFRYTFWMRTTAFLRANKIYLIFYLLSRFLLRRLMRRYGIDISHDTRIGSGFYVGHYGGIIVNWRSVIGKNCNISPGVVIGQRNRGPRKGCPTIGDYVFLGPGAKIIGAVKVGNHVAIGANCVVTRDIPDNAVVAGVPGKIISYGGSDGYINHTEYEAKDS